MRGGGGGDERGGTPMDRHSKLVHDYIRISACNKGAGHAIAWPLRAGVFDTHLHKYNMPSYNSI
jgi:hypothetical protein